VLNRLPRLTNPNLLVGFETSDDAGVFLLTPDCALVQTVDFFTPVVDDPFTFGAIAAANALSDVYAMGGKPLTALSILCYPQTGDLHVLEQILRGGLSQLQDAGVALAGGHSVNDPEIKFGYQITGTVHPNCIWKNAGARPGDVLVLTKSLGTGVLSTALKRGLLSEEEFAPAIASMLTLNQKPAEDYQTSPDLPVHAATDITGFGLLGHAREMALASNVTLNFFSQTLPLLPHAQRVVEAKAVPGGLNNNREFVGECVSFDPSVPQWLRALLFDPQTSGGLLLAVPKEHVRSGTVVGEVLPAGPFPLLVE
jgi:selenide, water dikinase